MPYFLSPLSVGDWGPHAKLTFSDSDYLLIKERDMWRFYFVKDAYSDVLRLQFDKSGKLMEIHRHKQLFELP